MSGLFNRLKSRKTAPPATSANSTPITTPQESEPAASAAACAFDEEGFLCPICHQKFADHNELAQHYTDKHVDEPAVEKEIADDVPQMANQIDMQVENGQVTDTNDEVARWKQQFVVSEESRVLLTTELMQHKQRAEDLEEELQLLQKHLKSTQTKVAEQSQEIANLKATKDVYDAQLAIFTDELLNTKDELKAKQRQVTTLCNDLIPRSTNDDVDVLKRELVTVQQCMNEMALEKEQQIETLRSVLTGNYQFVQRLEQLGDLFDQNLTAHELLDTSTSQLQSEIREVKQSIHLTRERKTKIESAIKRARCTRTEDQTEMNQLKADLVEQRQRSDKLTADFDMEQRQSNSYRAQIDTLNQEIQTLEKTLHDLREEKSQLIQTRIDADDDNERQNFIRQITQEKDQYEQQSKDLRAQIKQTNQQRQQIQEELHELSKQLSQLKSEKDQWVNERTREEKNVESLRKQLDDTNIQNEHRINDLNQELTAVRQRSAQTETTLHQANESNENQKRDIERLKAEMTDRIGQIEREKDDLQAKCTALEHAKEDIEQQLLSKQQLVDKLQGKLSQLHDQLDQKDNKINRLSESIRRSCDLTHKTQAYLQKTIHPAQAHVLAAIEQAQQESRSVRERTLEEIRQEFTHYLTVYHTLVTDNKKQAEQHQATEKQLNELKLEGEKRQKLESQLGDLNRQVLQLSESLEKQREMHEKQITSLERESESRNKRHDMQLSALRENLSMVRTELKTSNEKVANLEQIKAEKADVDSRLVVSQEERRVLLERSLLSESKYEKLLFENGQLTKKNGDLDAALQEIAREFQVLQIQTNKVNQRRWLNDDDVHSCMKCHQTFSVTQRKHHCRSCGNIFCDNCSSKTAIVAASSKKPQRVCDQCHKDLSS